MNESVYEIVDIYLRNSGYDINQGDLRLLCLSHPGYPNAESVTAALNHFKVPNVAVSVPYSSFQQLPELFIAYLSDKDHQDIVLIEKDRTNNGVKLHFSKSDSSYISTQKLEEIWSGVVIAVEDKDSAKRKSLIKKPDSWYRFRIEYLLLGLLVLNAIADKHLYGLITLVVALTGGYVSYLIISTEIGRAEPLAKKICNALSSNNGCSGVINSDSSKIYKNVGFSDLVLTFFATQIITYTLLGYNYTTMFLMFAVAIPFVMAAIVIQSVKIKKWCMLCLITSAIVVVGFVIGIIKLNQFTIDYLNILRTSIIGIAVLLIWLFVKRSLTDKKALFNNKIRLLKFKRNMEVFNTLLDKNTLNTGKYNITQLSYGSDNPKVTITSVINPFCEYCKDSFLTYHSLLSDYKESVKLNIVINLLDSNENTQEIAKGFIDTYADKGAEISLEQMRKWFSAEQIEAKLPEIVNREYCNRVIKEQNEFLIASGITYTPAMLINNSLYPDGYDTEDLKIFIEELLNN
jgi:uncharacterized membrane protein